MRKIRKKFRELLFGQTAIDSIVIFRIAFGAIMIWEVYRYFSKGWIKRYWIDTTYHFHFDGFAWLNPWPSDGMYIHFLVLGIAALGIMVGFLYRINTIIFFLGFTYIFLLEQARYLNHFYLVCLISFLMIFIPAHRAFSIDALFNAKLRSRTIDGWCLWILRFQLGVVYFYGGIAKINADWLQGEPMRIWLGKRVDYPFFGQFFSQEWCIYFFSYGGLLYDLLIVPLLIWRKTRVLAFCFSIFFHLTNAYIFSIGIFPWFMLVATTLFFTSHWPRKVIAVITGSELSGAQSLPKQESLIQLTKGQRVTRIGMILYVLLQIFIPLRHFLYPGNVSWTEEGHRFSWHMKLRTKRSKVRFVLYDPVSQKEWQVNPSKELARWQARKMSRHPRMILQYAHYLSQEKRKEGYGHIEVRVESETTLNGRHPQSIIDPSVDLAKEKISMLPASWILPLKEPL